MGKRVLVTGGAGLVGSHLCKRLLADGHRVVCLDNLSSGNRRNLESLIEQPGFSLVVGDVREPVEFDVEAIYNLACPASPVHYQADPVGTLKTNVLGALNVLELARRLDVPVLQASTSEVYGDPLEHPQRESYWGHVNPLGPRACYDEGKRTAETLFMDFHRQHGVRIRIARIFNSYGPNMHPADGRVVSNFIVQALEGRDLTIYGEGAQTRSFCFVDDLVDGLVRLMECGEGVTGPVNLGNPAEFTMLELAEMVLALTGSRSRLVHRPLPVDDPRQRRPDIALARALLGWEPAVPLGEGVARTIAYFEELLAEGEPA